MAARDELVAAVAGRYARATRLERGRILDEFVAVTGLHRKHAMRRLRGGQPGQQSGPRPGRRIYDEAVCEALIVIWEASDRICGKRLRPLVPILVETMQQHGHVRLAPEVRTGLRAMSAATMDPVLLLQRIRSAQQGLVEIADRSTAGSEVAAAAASGAATLGQFLCGLRTAWQDGEVRPTSRPKEMARRERRRPDPFVVMTAQVREWFEAEPWRTSRELFERLQAEHPGLYPDGQLRTLQRRLKGWRREVAHMLVFGTAGPGDEEQAAAATGAEA